MNTEKLTTKSRDAVTAAVRQALTHGNPNTEPVHLLHGLLLTPDNTVGTLLEAAVAARNPAAAGEIRGALILGLWRGRLDCGLHCKHARPYSARASMLRWACVVGINVSEQCHAGGTFDPEKTASWPRLRPFQGG